MSSLIMCPRYVVCVLDTGSTLKPRVAPKTQGTGIPVLPDVEGSMWPHVLIKWKVDVIHVIKTYY